MKVILAAALVAALSGCAVYPAGGYYEGPGYVAEPAYIWEPSVSLWYYNGPRGRHYMGRGWAPRGYHRGWRH